MISDTQRRGLVRAADRVEAAAWTDMYAAAPAELGLRVEHIADATVLIAPALPLGLFNRALCLGQDEPASATSVERIVRTFEEAGSAKFFVHAGPNAEPDLAPLLKSAGLVPGDPPFWAKTIHAAPAEPLDADVSARPIAPDEAAHFAAVIRVGHMMPPFLEPWLVALVGRSAWTAYGAYDAGKLVAGAISWSGAEGTWLGLAATLPDARRKGAQGALLRARTRDAGPGIVTTETWLPAPGEHNTSLANMHRAGFVTVAERANFQRRGRPGAQ